MTPTVIVLAVAVVAAIAIHFLRPGSSERRQWQEVLVTGLNEPDDAMRLHTHLKMSGVRSKVRYFGGRNATQTFLQGVSQTVAVDVHPDDVPQARQVMTDLNLPPDGRAKGDSG